MLQAHVALLQIANYKLTLTLLCCFVTYKCIHPDALGPSSGYGKGRSRDENVALVLHDILGPGNEAAVLPGFGKHKAALRSEQAGGLIFTTTEVAELKSYADECGIEFDCHALREPVANGTGDQRELAGSAEEGHVAGSD